MRCYNVFVLLSILNPGFFTYSCPLRLLHNKCDRMSYSPVSSYNAVQGGTATGDPRGEAMGLSVNSDCGPPEGRGGVLAKAAFLSRFQTPSIPPTSAFPTFRNTFEMAKDI